MSALRAPELEKDNNLIGFILFYLNCFKDAEAKTFKTLFTHNSVI